MKDRIRYAADAIGILKDIELHLSVLKDTLHGDSEFFKRFYSTSSIGILGLQSKKLSLMDVPKDMTEEHELLKKIVNKSFNLSGIFSLRDDKLIGEFDEMFDAVMSDIKCLKDKLFLEFYSHDEDWLNMPAIGLEITD